MFIPGFHFCKKSKGKIVASKYIQKFYVFFQQIQHPTASLIAKVATAQVCFQACIEGSPYIHLFV
jgi:hypothetical protein